MVTTFNDRIIHLKKTVAPLVGKPSALNINMDKTSSIGMKRHAPSAYARPMYQYTPPSRYTSAEAKRRRLKDELHYTAATVQQALANAGRPPVSILACRARALPRSVSTDGCTLISSKEYDAANAVVEEFTTATNADGAHDAQDEQSSVDEMLLYASLIQSTRHCYRLEESASLATPTESNKEDDRGDNDDDDDEYEELRASSDATSTWAPSSTCNNVNLNDKKTIDNDNRSDGTSSNPASSTSGEEEASDLSLSDQCEGDEASPSPPTVQEKENCSADRNLLNNEKISSDDLNNDENHNNDGVEDNDDNQTQVYFVVG